jgi:hypothetical protein
LYAVGNCKTGAKRRLNSAVTSWCGSGDRAASPHPRSRLTQLPLCFTRQKGSQSVSFYRSRAQ